MHSLTFLPGTLLDAQSFSVVASLLSMTVHSMRTNILGDCATFGAEITRQADSALAPQVWVGHSLGGIVAINLAIIRPEKCAAIVCISSTARADAPSNRNKRLAQLRRAQAAGSCEPISLEMKPVFGLTAGSRLAKSLAAQAATVGLPRFAHQTQYALTRPDHIRSHLTITCPILAMVGSDDDICPPELSDEIVALGAFSEHAHCVRIAGAGHLAPMTHPQEIAAHITKFLATVQSVNAPTS